MSFPAPVNALTCDTPGCSGSGSWAPVLILSDGRQIRVQKLLCSLCLRAATVDDFMTDTLWSAIAAMYDEQKKTPPRRELTRLTFAGVSSGGDPSLVAALRVTSPDAVGLSAGGLS